MWCLCLDSHHLVPTSLKFIRNQFEVDPMPALLEAFQHRCNVARRFSSERKQRKYPNLARDSTHLGDGCNVEIFREPL